MKRSTFLRTIAPLLYAGVLAAAAVGFGGCSTADRTPTSLVSPIEKPSPVSDAPNPYFHIFGLTAVNDTHYREEVWMGSGTHRFVDPGQTIRFSELNISGPAYARYLAYTASAPIRWSPASGTTSVATVHLVRISPGITRIVQN